MPVATTKLPYACAPATAGTIGTTPALVPRRFTPIALTPAPLIVHVTFVLRDGAHVVWPSAQPRTRGVVAPHAPLAQYCMPGGSGTDVSPLAAGMVTSSFTLVAVYP